MSLISASGRSPGGGNGNPLQYSWLENPMDRAAWWATVHGGHTESDITEQLSTHNNMTIAIKKVNSKYEKNLFEPV